MSTNERESAIWASLVQGLPVPVQDRGIVGDRQDRRTKLKGEIRQRLKSICANLSERDFQDLVEKIADNQLRGDARAMMGFAPIMRVNRHINK